MAPPGLVGAPVGFVSASAFPRPLPLIAPLTEGPNREISSPSPLSRGPFRLGLLDRYRPAGTISRRNSKFLFNRAMLLI